MLSPKVLAILWLLILQKRTSVLGGSSAAQPETSLCRQYHKINQTRDETFVEEFYKQVWGSLVLATRINYRTVIKTKWMMVEMCCEGYEPSQDDESPEHCVPVCPSGCHNGVCQLPNSCLCNPGYNASVNDVTRISQCLPHCSSGCIGGTCVAPEKCSCLVGYDLTDDSTSCKPACFGINAGGPENCGDEGICVAPDACQCRDGYGPRHWMTDYEGIINRTKPIYHNDREIYCFPLCEQRCPENAICTAPNTCSCNPGYRPNDAHSVEECLPICDQRCYNGFCKQPNSCQCNDGYRAHESLGSDFCEPVCLNECVNGKCVQPDQCECLLGYEKLSVQPVDQTEVPANVCIASCRGDCGHGSCVAPDRCHCDPGYVLKAVNHYGYNDWQSCEPSCDPSCNDESQCIAPNTCSCDPGYVREEDSMSCKPSCLAIGAGGPENCGDHGICVAPNACQCRDGYAPLHRIPQHEHVTDTTKPTFRRSWEIDCYPACQQPCPKNAACIAPNTCHCVNGYQPNNPIDFLMTECLPICEPPCANGFCKHPNVCQCHDGYTISQAGSHFCEPFCQDGCVNGTCVLPNKCNCFQGYEHVIIQSGYQTEVSPNVCTPACYPRCGNGTCITPNECVCDHGYVVENSFSPWLPYDACKPSCNPRCHDELFCVAPNNCKLLDPQPAHLQTFQTRIVEFPSKECGYSGSYSEINGTCLCNYQSHIDTTCTEPLLCAIVIVNDTESAKKFSLLEKVIVLERTSAASELYQSTMACQNECRISIVSNESLETLRNDTEQCYTLNLHDLTIGLMFNIPENLSLISDPNTNGSVICFVNAGFRCSRPNYEERKIERVVSAGVIAGATFLVAIIFVLALSIYLTRRKIQKLFRGSLQTDEAMMDRSEATDSPFHTDDAPHL